MARETSRSVMAAQERGPQPGAELAKPAEPAERLREAQTAQPQSPDSATARRNLLSRLDGRE